MDSKYAITEIITSGLNFKVDRIIHISSFVVDQNEIKSHITTYINPERTLDPDYIKSTGIVNDNIKFSPKFYEKAKSLIQLWSGCNILSVSPRITLTFLKKEFKSLGFDFSQNIGQYSDLVNPEYPQIDLIEDKARILTNYFLEFGTDTPITKKDFTPRAFLEKEIKLMPNECGIYILKNENGTVIYIGKAIKIRTRLRQHFRNLNSKGFKIHRMVSAIEHQITESELFALLIEQHHILKYKPELNKALRNNIYKYELRYLKDVNQKDKFEILPVGKSTIGHSVKRFRSRKSALAFILHLTHTYDIKAGQIKCHRMSKESFQKALDNLEFENETEIPGSIPLSELVIIINPFYKGKYIVEEKGFPNSHAIIENGFFLGLSLTPTSGLSFEKIKENIEYPYQSEYALSQNIRYLQEGLLKITRH